MEWKRLGSKRILKMIDDLGKKKVQENWKSRNRNQKFESRSVKVKYVKENCTITKGGVK